MDFNSILIGSEDPKRLVDYYTKVIGEPRSPAKASTPAGDRVGPDDRSAFGGEGPQSRPGRLIWNIVTTTSRETSTA